MRLKTAAVRPQPSTPPRSAARWIGAALVTLLVALLALLVIDPTPSSAVDRPSNVKPTMRGVNLANAEFAPEKLPGVPGQDYNYPGKSTAAPFLAMGMNTIRLPFLWERIQPKPMAALDPAELKRLDEAVAGMAGFKVVILDLHNYARYRGKVLDPADGSGAMLDDVWRRLAAHYKGSPQIAFGIMNEPHGIDAGAWRAIAEGTVRSIRQTGARNLILVPGTHWSGGHSWFNGGERSNAAQMAGFKDPGGNFLFEIHQYLDIDSSGSHPTCVGPAIGRNRLTALTAWLRKEKAGALLGEFGASSNPGCLAAMDNLLTYLDTHGDVWRGWTYWAAGDWWGDYFYSVQPDSKGQPKPQAAVLQRHLR